MKDIKVTDSVKYIGVDDHDIDLFESQYVVPNGVSYNSYVILDDITWEGFRFAGLSQDLKRSDGERKES